MEYSEGAVGDYTDYSEYYYEKDDIKEFESRNFFKKISEDDIEYIKSFFVNYQQALQFVKFKEKYNFNIDNIKVGDFYYIKTKNKDNPLFNYDVFYFDVDKLTLYYIHYNI